MDQKYKTIRDAILSKKQIVAEYRGHERLMCPHVLGTKNGKAQALFYQFGGESSSGLDPDGSAKNWRCMFLDQLDNVESQDGEWHTAPNHTRTQSCVEEVDVEVDY